MIEHIVGVKIRNTGYIGSKETNHDVTIDHVAVVYLKNKR